MILPPSSPGPSSPPHVVRCADLVDSIAREGHYSVEVPGYLAEHRVYFDRRGVPPVVALRCVASAVNASLVPSRGGYRIERTPDDLRLIRERNLRVRSQWFSDRLKGLVAFRKANLSTGSRSDAILRALRRDVADLEALQKGLRPSFPADSAGELLPSQNLLEGLVRRVGVPTLAASRGERTDVFEDSPVPTAKPLPRHDDLSRVYATEAESLLAGPLATSIEESGLDASAAQIASLPARPQSGTRLRLRSYSNENAVWLTLESFDSAGRRIDRAFLMASPSGTRVPSSAFVWQASRNPASRWIELSASARSALDALNGPVASLPDWFLDPVGREPLDLFVREAVVGLVSDEKAACIAMDVPDALWGLVRGCVGKSGVSMDGLRGSLAEWLPYERVENENGVSWRPIDPESSEARSSSREALRRFARTVSLGRPADFRATCRLYHEASRADGQFPDTFSALVSRAAPAGISGRLPSRIYALLGAIPDASWANLMAGAASSAGRLRIASELQRVFATETDLTVQSSDGRSVADIERYPLELFRDAEVGECRIAVSTKPEAVVRFWSPEKREPDFWAGTASLAASFRVPSFYFVLREGQWVCRLTRENYERGIDKLSYRRGTRRATRLTIGLPKGLHVSIELPSDVDPERQAIHYRDLPQEVRDANWNQAIHDGLLDAQRRKDKERP